MYSCTLTIMNTYWHHIMWYLLIFDIYWYLISIDISYSMILSSLSPCVAPSAGTPQWFRTFSPCPALHAVARRPPTWHADDPMAGRPALHGGQSLRSPLGLQCLEWSIELLISNWYSETSIFVPIFSPNLATNLGFPSLWIPVLPIRLLEVAGRGHVLDGSQWQSHQQGAAGHGTCRQGPAAGRLRGLGSPGRCLGSSWDFMGFHRISWDFIGFHGDFMGFHGEFPPGKLWLKKRTSYWKWLKCLEIVHFRESQM